MNAIKGGSLVGRVSRASFANLLGSKAGEGGTLLHGEMPADGA